MNYRAVLLKILFLVLILCLVGSLIANMTFGFMHLLLVFAILVIIPLFYPPRSMPEGEDMDMPNTPIPWHYSIIGSVFLIILLGCCYYTLNNYINPSGQIFTNNDHHAVRVDGLSVTNPKGFVLAADDDCALLDTIGFPGEATIADVGGGMVQLRLKGVTRPLYNYFYNANLRNYKSEVINCNDKFIIGPSDPSFTLINNANHRLKVTIEETEYRSHWYSPYKSDSTTYWYQLDGAEPQKASYSTYLHTGYGLDHILPEIEGFDLIGIALVRPEVYPTAKRNEAFGKLGGRYTFDIRTEALQNGSIKAIECNGQTFELSALAKQELTVDIPFGQTIVFGLGEIHTEPLKFEEPKEGENGIRLIYDCPVYRTLAKINGEARNTLYITSTLAKGDKVVDPDLPENVLLFDFFHRRGNIHNMTPSYLTFYAGPTNEALRMNLAVGNSLTKDIKAGSPLPNIGVCDNSQEVRHGESWIMSVQNFKATTPFSPLKICLYLLVLTIVSIIVLNFGNGADKFPVTYSHAELAVYMLVLCFMTIRLFLMWRLSVFPPVNSITKFELHNFFWNGSMWRYFYIFAIVCYVGIFYFKLCVINYDRDNWFSYLNILVWRDKLLEKISGDTDDTTSSSDIDPYELAEKQRREMLESDDEPKVTTSNQQLQTFKDFGKELLTDRFLGAFVLLSIIAGVLCFLFHSQRMFTIFLPVLFYLLGDMLLTAKYGRTYKQDMEEAGDEYTASHVRSLHVKPFFLTSLNMLFWGIVMFLNDGGFGILFISFGLIWTQLKLREIDLYTGGYGGKLISLLLIFMATLLVFYKDLFLLAVSYPLAFILACGLIAFVIVLLVCRTLGGQFDRGAVWGISASAAIIVGIGATMLAELVIPGSHIEQRIRVHMSSPAEQLSSIGDTGTERRFLEASLNDWILAEYYNNGNDIKLLGDWGQSYFQLKPHSKLGAMWGAQASDISLSRYVIAEHGGFLPIALICAFLLLLGIGISRSSHSRVAKGLLIQIPLLLFIQSLLIWMTVTRRFIFLGQDFPLLSCNSKVTILYTMALLSIWVCAMIHESLFVSERTVAEDDSIIRSSNQNMWHFLVLMLLVSIAFTTRQVINHYQSGVYELSGALENLSKTLNKPIIYVSEDQVIDNRIAKDPTPAPVVTSTEPAEEVTEQDETTGIAYSINELIDIWQAEVTDRKDTAYLKHHIVDIGNTHAVMKAFDEKYWKYISAALDKDPDMQLTKRLYRFYIDDLSRRNSYDGILHMHRNRATGRATLAVRTDHYHASLPSRPRYSWTGNIIGAKRQRAARNQISSANYNLMRFPGSWFKDGQDVVILKRSSGSISIRSKGTEAPLNIEEDVLSQAVRIFPKDKVSVGTREVNLSAIMPEWPVWARNLQVNGQRRFVYPMQEKNFWIRNFTNEMNLIAKRRLSNKEETQIGDIPISLDRELELSIYNTIAQNKLPGDERTVVVANGDGHICAMVDYKVPRFRLNPNDEKRILDMDKKLYMIGGHGSEEERRCLGSSALMHLSYGMGSTQKPLVYAAVSSGFDLGASGTPFTGWNALNLDTIRQNLVDIANLEVYMHYYTGIPFYDAAPFRSPLGDEGGTGMVNPLFYIRKSSNYYNSLLVYMGSFPSEFYAPARVSSFLQVASTKDGSTLFHSVKAPHKMDETEYQHNWPIMRIGGKPLAFNMSPASTDQSKSLLQQQFNKLFDLPAAFDRRGKTSLYYSICDSAHLTYVYPEHSFLDASMRTQKGSSFVETTIRQTATGQRIVWNVTPVMMAQMYARLLPGQAKVRLSIDPNSPAPPLANLDAENNPKHREVMNVIYRGMNAVFTSGTASGVYNRLKASGYLAANPKTESPSHFPNKHYWIYGKTGTIGRKTKGEKRDNDRLLAVIITNRDLTTVDITKAEDYDLRYYVIFMDFFNTPDSYSALQTEIIKQVMDSQEFKEYM